jgi:hypothetical protein
VSSALSRNGAQMNTTKAHFQPIERIPMISKTAWHSSTLAQSQKFVWKQLCGRPRMFMKLVYRFLV